MKTLRFLVPVVFALFMVVSSFSACESDTLGPKILYTPEGEELTGLVYNPDAEELAGLVYMREEEKLARDVYIFLFQKYGVQSFDNISNSEQVHMDVILDLLEKYNIPDPATNQLGKFTNQTLQQLYDDLISEGTKSVTAALIAGATIEDVDIRDLNNFISGTTREDIVHAYELLACGSRNHMRAFVRQLNKRDVDYTPQFISKDEFDSIILGEHEKCGRLYNTN